MKENWILFSEEQPPQKVEWYDVINSNGDKLELEWYEGSGFKWCSEGHWSDEEGEEVDNIIYWRNNG